MQQRVTTIATTAEALSITAICFGWFIFSAFQSAFNPSQPAVLTDERLISIIASEVAFGGVAILVLRWRRWSVSDLFPHPTALGCGVGLLLYLVSIPASWFAMAPFYEPQFLQPLRDLIPHQRPSLSTVIGLAMVNGLYEEAFLLGYLLRGLRDRGLVFALGASLLVRLLYHVYQGPIGAASVLAFGLVVSLYYIRFQSLWPAVFAHSLADILAFL